MPVLSCGHDISESEVLQAAQSILTERRWGNKTPEERKKFAKRVAAQGAGRPRKDEPRCPCGAMTLTRALTRWPKRGGKCPDCPKRARRPIPENEKKDTP